MDFHDKHSEGELVDYIRRAILAGKYMPREHLVESKLSEIYSVSRTPVREALRQLETMGLVVREKNKGARVADIDLDTIHEMQQVRASLEGMAAMLTAQQIGREDLALLVQYVGNMERAIQELSIDEYTYNNDAFHAHINRCCNNRYLEQTLNSIMIKTMHQPCKTWKGLGDIRHTQESHREILKAIQTRDPFKAQHAATQHVLDALVTQKRFSE